MRVRLVAAMLALVTLALLVIGATSVFALRDYLVGRVDSQLAGAVPGAAALAQDLPAAQPDRLAADGFCRGVSDHQWHADRQVRHLCR